MFVSNVQKQSTFEFLICQFARTDSIDVSKSVVVQ